MTTSFREEVPAGSGHPGHDRLQQQGESAAHPIELPSTTLAALRILAMAQAMAAVRALPSRPMTARSGAPNCRIQVEWLLRHADQVLEEMGSAWPYAQPTWVFAHRPLQRIPGGDIRFVQGPVGAIHQQMVRAAAGKNVWIVGGGDLAAQFHDAGLLDEVIVQVASVTLGRGKPLFPRRVTNPPWKLVAVRQVGAGMTELRYEVPSRLQARELRPA